ncbi:MAG: hypothetical protein H8E91_07230 [Planctomycetes bacterium]|nr:hypothetical protein [Planctomycetota bacterium]
MNLRTCIGLGLLVSMMLIGSSVYAQDTPDDLLAGPTVQDEEVTQEDMRSERARSTGKDSIDHQSRQQLRMWLTTLQSLDLTKEQQTEIKSLVEQLQKSQSAFQKKYGKEIRELKEKSKEAKKNGTDIPDDVGTRTRELQTMAPKPEEYQSKAWALLSEDQQAEFQKKYQAVLEELKKRLEKRKGKNDPMMDGPQQGEGLRNGPTRDRKRPERGDLQIDKDHRGEASLRRARFLRRIRQLQEENE